MPEKKSVLIIDDDTYISNLLRKYLEKNGYYAKAAYSGNTGKNLIKNKDFDLVLCDYRLPDTDGQKLLNYIKSKNPGTIVIIMTAYAEVNLAVKLIKSGAFDYITKPIHPEELLQILSSALEKKREKENKTTFFKNFISGTDKNIQEVMKHVQMVAPTDLNVLIEGETGSGKEYIAKAIHFKSERRDNPFIAVDCGAIPKELANSELFGHIKGSFTGAIKDKTGIFEEADGGTLFLDEVGNLSYEVQVKLLRALQERMITKVGDTKSISVNLRIISASNVDLQLEVDNDNFRKDLYHRLNEFKLKIPPLRERQEDINVFIDEFIKSANERMNKNVAGIDPALLKLMEDYPWYGNLRELRNVINRAVLMASDEYITIDCLPPAILNLDSKSSDLLPEKIIEEKDNKLKDASREIEKHLIQKALKDADFNKSKAARMLNIDRKTLYNKISLYNIDT